MKDNIVKFPKEFIERLTDAPLPVNKILLGADKAELDEVIVLGLKDGEIEVFSSDGEIGKILVLMESAKILLMNSFVNDRQIKMEIIKE